MVKGMTIQIGARVPLSIVEFMDNDVNNNEFQNRSDWVVCACREFVKIRQKEISEKLSRDLPGGGEYKKFRLTGIARQSGSEHPCVFFLILLEFLDGCF